MYAHEGSGVDHRDGFRVAGSTPALTRRLKRLEAVMGGFQLPGAFDRCLHMLDVDDGTLCLQHSPRPDPIFNQWIMRHVRAFGVPSVPTDANETMVASDNAATFIASFEAMGFICPDGKVRAYQDGGCGKGFWTIGIGEMSGKTSQSEFDTETDAYDSFIARVKGEYSERVRKALKRQGVTRRLTQNEFDALVDMAYQRGNCYALARRIAHNKPMTRRAFVSLSSSKHRARRSAEHRLFSGQEVTVHGYARYFRHDNTNGGYCPIHGKRGYHRVNSPDEYTLTY